MSSQVFNLEHLLSFSASLLPRQVAVLNRAMSELPPLPFHLQELHAHLRAMPLDLDEITRLVASQKLLLWHVLTISNAGQPGRPLNLEHSVLLLGAERLRTLAIACSLISSKAGQANSHLPGRIAQASLRAMLCHRIANDVSYPDPEKAYIAGLLKDLGRSTVMADSNDEDSSEIAAWMAALWNVPADIVSIIRNLEQKDAENSLSQIVRDADVICEAWIGKNQAGLETRSELGLQQALRANLVKLSDAECRDLALDMWTRLAVLLTGLNEVN